MRSTSLTLTLLAHKICILRSKYQEWTSESLAVPECVVDPPKWNSRVGGRIRTGGHLPHVGWKYGAQVRNFQEGLISYTRHMEVIGWEGTVDPLLGHQHQVRSVRLGDALTNIPERGHHEGGECFLRENQAHFISHHESKDCFSRKDQAHLYWEMGQSARKYWSLPATLRRYWSWNCFTTSFFISSAL